MKVYVKKWNGMTFEVSKAYEIDSYNGLGFWLKGTSYAATTVNVPGVRVTEMYVHASEPNTLVVYCEEVKG